MRRSRTSLAGRRNQYAAFLLLCLLVFSVPSLSRGEGQYVIGRYTIGGGGGATSGGAYRLVGTIGQPHAGWSSGGKYELLGGFQPSGPICTVGFDDFAEFAEGWLETGTGLAGDLDGDNDVDLDDLRRFADYWLSCCPHKWPLK